MSALNFIVLVGLKYLLRKDLEKVSNVVKSLPPNAKANH